MTYVEVNKWQGFHGNGDSYKGRGDWDGDDDIERDELVAGKSIKDREQKECIGIAKSVVTLVVELMTTTVLVTATMVVVTTNSSHNSLSTNTVLILNIYTLLPVSLLLRILKLW